MKTYSLLIIFWLSAFLLHGLSVPASSSVVDWKYLEVEHVRDIAGNFNQPTEVAVSDSGRVYILDGANNKIDVCNQKGEKLFSVGQTGSEKGEFAQPVGLDVDSRDNIYVADTGNSRIQIFDKRGSFVSAIDLADKKARPVEIKLQAASERIYISDTQNHQILCYKPDGSFVSSWGGHGKKEGQFNYPGMADTDAAGNLHVVDILNGRLQVFGPKGSYLRQIGDFGITAGKLFRPKGIAIHSDTIFVSDSYTGVIQCFDSTGNLSGILSEDGRTPLRLTTPLGMAIDVKQNHLYVVQRKLNKISVFSLPSGR